MYCVYHAICVCIYHTRDKCVLDLFCIVSVCVCQCVYNIFVCVCPYFHLDCSMCVRGGSLHTSTHFLHLPLLLMSGVGMLLSSHTIKAAHVCSALSWGSSHITQGLPYGKTHSENMPNALCETITHVPSHPNAVCPLLCIYNKPWELVELLRTRRAACSICYKLFT